MLVGDEFISQISTVGEYEKCALVIILLLFSLSLKFYLHAIGHFKILKKERYVSLKCLHVLPEVYSLQ